MTVQPVKLLAPDSLYPNTVKRIEPVDGQPGLSIILTAAGDTFTIIGAPEDIGAQLNSEAHPQ